MNGWQVSSIAEENWMLMSYYLSRGLCPPKTRHSDKHTQIQAGDQQNRNLTTTKRWGSRLGRRWRRFALIRVDKYGPEESGLHPSPLPDWLKAMPLSERGGGISHWKHSSNGLCLTWLPWQSAPDCPRTAFKLLVKCTGFKEVLERLPVREKWSRLHLISAQDGTRVKLEIRCRRWLQDGPRQQQSKWQKKEA